jgi:hypothetical protein
VPCDGTFVAGALADAPPAIAKETPAAPNIKAVLRRLRLELCFVRAMVGLHVRATHRECTRSRKETIENLVISPRHEAME